MTPARKAALQFFHDRGEVSVFDICMGEFRVFLKANMINGMVKDGQLIWINHESSAWTYSLTDAGRRALHEAGK